MFDMQLWYSDLAKWYDDYPVNTVIATSGNIPYYFQDTCNRRSNLRLNRLA